jgi:hypothetical protein
MTSTPTPTPVHVLGPVVAFEATETSLSGHEVVCSCGLRMATSLSARFARKDAVEHLAYWYNQGHSVIDWEGPRW